jgi:hypothetical protein
MIHSTRRILALVAISFVITLIGVGCGGDSTTKPPTELAPPTNLKAINGETQIQLQWTASPDQGGSGWTGYQIYRSRGSMPLTTTPPDSNLLGTTAATATSYTDSGTGGPADTTLYYYQVRAKTGDKVSVGVQVRGIRRPEGTGRIIVEFEGSGSSGFNFITGQPVSLSHTNQYRFELTDIYLGTASAEDDSTNNNNVLYALTLKSPEKLAAHTGGDPLWAEVQSRILDTGGTDFTISTGTDPSQMESPAIDGHVYIVKTPRGHYAKLQILDVTTTSPREITFKYAYQIKPGLLLF